MRKICFVVPTMKKGGMERVAAELCNYLINSCEVVIVCAIKGEIKYQLDPRIKVIKNENFNKIKIISFLSKVLKDNKPDIVIGFSEFLNPYTIISSKLNKLKVYVSDRSNPLKKHSFRDNFFRKLTYPFADGLIAQTNFAKSVFTQKGFNKNIFVLSNPLMEIKNKDIQSENKGIVMVGRFAQSKNQKDLIEIFSKSNNKEWKLYLVGDGEYKEDLMRMAADFGISNQVVFTGEVDNVEEYMSKSSIFAFTSLSEGFPNALSEAIAFPLAVISYDCKAGVSDLITDNENGFLIKEGDKDSFIEKLNLLMVNNELRRKMMNKGILNREKYHPREIVEQLLQNIK